jgi:arylsulfatase A-like enzyme
MRKALIASTAVAFVGFGAHWFFHNWMFVSAFITSLRHPVLPNQPVIWSSPKETSLKPDKSRPNVVVILADDLGFNDLSYSGGGFHGIKTPHIDAIAKSGAVLRNAYSGHATCAPSRASILTGRFPTKFGFEFTPLGDVGAWIVSKFLNADGMKGVYKKENAIGASWDIMSIPKSTPTLAEAFRDVGYRTLGIGKWHVGYGDSSPSKRGFDEVLGFNIGVKYFSPKDPRAVNCEIGDMFDKFAWSHMRFHVRHNDGEPFEPNDYLPDYFVDEATKAIDANANHPFFMYFATPSIHTPLQALRSDYDSLTRIEDHCERVYGAMIVALDRSVGRLLRALDERNMTDNTIVIFTNDNGGPGYLGIRGLNDPLRGFKGTFFEGGIKVPMFIKWPSKIPSGLLVDAVAGHVDIFPTVLSAAGAKTSDELDGKDLLPFLTTRDATTRSDDIHKYLFWRSGEYMALRAGDWKIQSCHNPKKLWLFNLAIDPEEHNNVAEKAEFQDKLNELLGLMIEVNSTQSRPIWPSVTETAVFIDKQSSDKYVPGDEYIYWAN